MSCKRLLCHLSRCNRIVLDVLEGGSLEVLDVVVDHHVDVDGIIAKPDHTATRHCSKRSVLQCLDFEHDANVRRKVKTLTVGQGQQFVVVKHRVQVLDPLRIDITIKDDPVTLAIFATQVVDNLAKNASEQAIGPFAGCVVQGTVQLLFRHDFRIDHMADALYTIGCLERIQKRPPCR